MPTGTSRTGRVESARESKRAAHTEARAWRVFRKCLPPDIAKRVDEVQELGGVTVRDVQLLAAAMLLDCVGTGMSPQKEQACLRVLETTAKWLAVHVKGEGDRMVKVPEGAQRMLAMLQGGKKDLGDDLTA